MVILKAGIWTWEGAEFPEGGPGAVRWLGQSGSWGWRRQEAPVGALQPVTSFDTVYRGLR